jgi:hypothetical protein
MEIFLLTFVVFLLALGGMAIGVIVSDRRIKGSCGGLAAMDGMESDCAGACRRPCPKRRAAMRREAREAARTEIPVTFR